jgi:hypothetical protein
MCLACGYYVYILGSLCVPHKSTVCMPCIFFVSPCLLCDQHRFTMCPPQVRYGYTLDTLCVCHISLCVHLLLLYVHQKSSICQLCVHYVSTTGYMSAADPLFVRHVIIMSSLWVHSVSTTSPLCVCHTYFYVHYVSTSGPLCVTSDPTCSSTDRQFVHHMSTMCPPRVHYGELCIFDSNPQSRNVCPPSPPIGTPTCKYFAARFAITSSAAAGGPFCKLANLGI